MDVDLDLLRLVVRVDELGLADEGRFRVALRGVHDGHACDVLDRAQVLVEHNADLIALAHDFVEDVNLVLNRDATVLAQPLDAIGDLTAETLALQLWGDLGVQHHCGGSLGLAAPVLVGLDRVCEGLDHLEHTFGHLVSIHINATFAQVALNLVVGQLRERCLECLVELFLEGLAHELVVGLDSVLDVGVLVLGEL